MASRPSLRISHLKRSTLAHHHQPLPLPTKLSTPSTIHQSRHQSTTRRTTKALRIAPSATARPNSKYIHPLTTTLIFNPPPTLPSPHQTPLLFLPPSDPRKHLLSQSHAFTNPYANGVRALPPLVRHDGYLPEEKEKRYHLSEADVTEMRKLRDADPWEWTVPKLAERFGCSRIFVAIAAPASLERREWGLAAHQRFRDRWGGKRSEAVEARHKRRRLWERDL